MPCSKCGAEVNTSDLVCPNCQEKLTPTNEASSATQTPMKRPMPFWYKIAVFLTVIALIAVSAGLLFTESLVNVPQKQLKALRENDIESAYQNFTSSEFKAATSLNQFRQFAEVYPVLVTHQSVLFPQRSIIDHMLILKGKLIINENNSTPIEYRLIKEEGKWKIFSLILLKGQTQNKAEKKKIISMTKILLRDIQTDQIDKGYENSFSESFKQVTSLKEFKSLVQSYPLFTQKFTSTFHNAIIHEDQASVAIVLKTDTSILYLKNHYNLIEKKWKISSIRILTPTLVEK